MAKKRQLDYQLGLLGVAGAMDEEKFVPDCIRNLARLFFDRVSEWEMTQDACEYAFSGLKNDDYTERDIQREALKVMRGFFGDCAAGGGGGGRY